MSPEGRNLFDPLPFDVNNHATNLEWMTIVTLKYPRLKFFSLRLSQLTMVLVCCVWASVAQSRADYDIDDDGLVEIQSIADIHKMLTKTDQLRRQPYSGCPNQKCIGFELTQDLNFPSDTLSSQTVKKTIGYQGVNAQKPVEPSPYSAVNWPVIKRFKLVFEGNGYQISNISLNNQSRAMFNSATNAVFRNITLSMNPKSMRRNAVLVDNASGSEFNNVTIKEGYALKGLMARTMRASKINNCDIKGVVEGSHGVGLLVGEVKKTLVSNCKIKGKVTASHGGGLIAGISKNSEFHDLDVKGYIVGRYNTAGGIGEVANSLFRQVTVEASVTGIYLTVGGLAGNLEGSDIRNSLFTGNINATTSKVGGVAGIIVGSHLQENEVDAQIVANQNLGLIGGFATNSVIEQFKFSGLATLDLSSANQGTTTKPITDWFAQSSATTLSKTQYHPTPIKKPEAKAWYSALFE